MNHDHDRLPPDHGGPDAPEREALNAWLDAMADGDPPPATDLDPDLRRAAEWLAGLYDTTIDAHLDPARQASTWRALLGSQPGGVPDVAATSGSDGDGTPAPREIHRTVRRGIMRRSTLAPTPLPLNISAPPASEHAARHTTPTPSGWRLVGSRTMGVAATLLLVAMLAASGFAVYLTAPRHHTDEPSSHPCHRRRLGHAGFGAGCSR